MNNACPWLWDVDMDEAAFERCLRGKSSSPFFDADWALTRLLEYAPYREIRRLLPEDTFIQRWECLAPRIRSSGRREGAAFLRTWLIQQRSQQHA